MDINLKENINALELNDIILKKLYSNNIISIEDLWKQNRLKLKELGFSDNEINNIIIKLQLKGISLNKKINNNDKFKTR